MITVFMYSQGRSFLFECLAMIISLFSGNQLKLLNSVDYRNYFYLLFTTLLFQIWYVHSAWLLPEGCTSGAALLTVK